MTDKDLWDLKPGQVLPDGEVAENPKAVQVGPDREQCEPRIAVDAIQLVSEVEAELASWSYDTRYNKVRALVREIVRDSYADGKRRWRL